MFDVYGLPEWGQLVEAVRAAPLDGTRKLGAADWLDENGESERAELVRLGVRSMEVSPPRAVLCRTIQFDKPPIDVRGKDFKITKPSREVGWERKAGGMQLHLERGENPFPIEVGRCYTIDYPTPETAPREKIDQWKTAGIAPVTFHVRVTDIVKLTPDREYSQEVEETESEVQTGLYQRSASWVIHCKVVPGDEADAFAEERVAVQDRIGELVPRVGMRALWGMFGGRKDVLSNIYPISFSGGFQNHLWCSNFQFWKEFGPEIRRREPFTRLRFTVLPKNVVLYPSGEFTFCSDDGTVVKDAARFQSFQKLMESVAGGGIYYDYADPPTALPRGGKFAGPDGEPERPEGLTDELWQKIRPRSVTVVCAKCRSLNTMLVPMASSGRNVMFDCAACGERNSVRAP